MIEGSVPVARVTESPCQALTALPNTRTFLEPRTAAVPDKEPQF